MNQYEFYSNFFKYRSNKEDLQHASTYGDYYHKIDNYYGPGKSRYFETKDEYDAYLREQQKMYDKAVEEQKQNKIEKFTSGRDVAIRKSNNNYAVISAVNKAKELTESDKQKQESSANNARGAGNDYQKYLNKGYSDILPGAQRAKKDKENAEKYAKKVNLLKQAQSGREAAIRNSNTAVSNEEYERRVQKDKEYRAEQEKMKNPVYSAMKKIQKGIEKRIDRSDNLTNQQKSREDAVNRSEHISNDEWKKRLKEDKEWQKMAKKPGGKIVADVLVMNKKVLNSEKERQAQLDKLDKNFKEFNGVLQKLKNNGVSLTESELNTIKKNPLYGALNWSLSNGDTSYDILDVITVGGKASETRINQIEKNLNDLVATLEDTINESKIKKQTETTVAENKKETKEQPRPGRSAI